MSNEQWAKAHYEHDLKTGKQQVDGSTDRYHPAQRLADIEGRIEPSAREIEGLHNEQVGEVQGDGRAMLLKFGEQDLREGSRSNGHDGVDHDDWVDYIEVPVEVLNRIAAALAARQPVAFANPDDAEDVVGVERLQSIRNSNGLPGKVIAAKYTVPLFRTPAQAVDLGQFRDLIEALVDRCGATLSVDEFILAGRLLALIDGKVPQ